jgi:hypothetical protein
MLTLLDTLETVAPDDPSSAIPQPIAQRSRRCRFSKDTHGVQRFVERWIGLSEDSGSCASMAMAKTNGVGPSDKQSGQGLQFRIFRPGDLQRFHRIRAT